MYEQDRLTSAIARMSSCEPREMIERLVAEMDSFADGQEPDDDQTVVVVGMRPDR
jgi:serine phosphatase RsbU (regulator of sigma subunit)